MENRAHALAAGLFTLLLVAALVAVALWFQGDTKPRTTYVLASKGSVSGLNIQAPVRLRGVDVGKVTGIRFDPQEPRFILIDIAVDAGTPVTNSTFAQLGSQGVTGLSYVQLDDDGSKPQLRAADDKAARIEVRPSFFDQVTTSGQDGLGSATEVTRRVNTLLNEDNQKQLLRTLSEIESTSAAVSKLSQQLAPTLNGLPGLLANTNVTIKRADGLIVNLDELTAKAGKKIDVVDRIAAATEQLSATGQAIGQGLTHDTLPRINAAADEASRVSRQVARLADDLDEQPHSLVFGRSPLPPGPGEPGFNPASGVAKP
jgi:phospholipid/cholesterol/gamma-HCH transport system substrate-binding protein